MKDDEFEVLKVEAHDKEAVKKQILEAINLLKGLDPETTDCIVVGAIYDSKNNPDKSTMGAMIAGPMPLAHSILRTLTAGFNKVAKAQPKPAEEDSPPTPGATIH